MKVFVSWSRKVSHEVALAFKEWLPLVIQSIDPYVSSEDIQMGARWSSEIEKALSESSFGIICLTSENLLQPWIHFEAGALSKAIENSQVNVCPFLFNIGQGSVEGPLKQFQSVRNERNEMFKLVSSINAAAKSEHERVKPKILEQSFQAFWPTLEERLKTIADGSPSVPAPKRNSDDVLEEVLEIVRSQSRLAASRQDVLFFTEWLAQQIQKLEAPRAFQLLNPGGPLVAGLSGFSGVSYGPNVLASRVFGDNIQIDNPPIPPVPEPDKSDAEDSEATNGRDRKKK